MVRDSSTILFYTTDLILMHSAVMNHTINSSPPYAPVAASSEVMGEDPELVAGQDEESYGTTVIGNVEDRACILIDDLIDSAHPFGA